MKREILRLLGWERAGVQGGAVITGAKVASKTERETPRQTPSKNKKEQIAIRAGLVKAKAKSSTKK